MKIVFFGSSLLSAYWNGAATYYRGILKELARRGYSITFCEPDIFDRQKNRDIAPPDWAHSVVYAPDIHGLHHAMREVEQADIIVKASGIGIFDEHLAANLPVAAPPNALKIYWDVDAPATLADLADGRQPRLAEALPHYDIVFTYGGGPPVILAFAEAGARQCVPIHNALDPETHFPVLPEARFRCDLGLLANRLPDREARINEFFFHAAQLRPTKRFMLAGSGWEGRTRSDNVRLYGHLPTGEHNAFNSSSRMMLNVARDKMAEIGYSPATRIFEAAGAGACIITDDWPGLDLFLSDGQEILVARDGPDVADYTSGFDPEKARAIGEAARMRILAEHTYGRRAGEVDRILRSLISQARERGLASLP